jgi:hypothetical protein
MGDSMRTYRITLEVELKPINTDLAYDDFIFRAIEEQLERDEDIIKYDIEELTQ